MQATKPKQHNRCMYCGSTSFGKGCRYAPHGVHFHPENSLRCAYCDSTSFGKGCKLNPISDLHIHGVNYNNMFRESVQSYLDNSVILNEIKKEFKNFEACKLGIIDEKGNRIKNPVTEQEQLSYSPFVRTILKLKKYLGAKIDLLEASSKLEQSSIPVTESIVKYNKIVEYQDKVNAVVNELYKTLDEAQQDGLSLEDVKRLIQA
jgi:hypothetical protein